MPICVPAVTALIVAVPALLATAIVFSPRVSTPTTTMFPAVTLPANAFVALAVEPG
jgi:hypothetical protein